MSERSVGPDDGIEVFANKDEILLGVLTAIERDANTSQRTLSREIGVALGLANAYLNRCVRKGLIKIQQVPRRRYAYYLTPQGFAEKARLTGQYLSASFTFFRRARAQLSDIVAQCAANGWQQIALAGISDLAEVAILCTQDQNVSLVAVIAPEKAGQRFHGLPVVATLAECGRIDAVIVTTLTSPTTTFRDLEQEFGAGRVVAPPLLRINRRAVDEQPAP